MSRFLSFVVLCLFAVQPLGAQETAPAASLGQLREAAVRAIASKDLEAQMACLHPKVVVVWQNGEVSSGQQAVREYITRGLKGDQPRLRSFAAEVAVEEMGIAHGGDTAVAYGTAKESLTLATGRPLELMGRWSATMVREQDRWLIAELHVSANVFDNPLLNSLKSGMVSGSVLSLIVGGIFGYLFARRRYR